MNKNLSIHEFIELKKNLNTRITKAINEQLQWFENETGLTPSGISIFMQEVTAIGDESRRYELFEVNVEVDI